MSDEPVRRSKFLGIAGLAVGALMGAASVVLTGTAVAHRFAAGTPAAFLEATHVPPLLTAPDEPVELRYDAYCAGAEEPQSDAPCKATGSVFVRAGQVGRFSEIALREDTKAAEGRLWAPIPASMARASTGFTYYAVIRSVANGNTVTLPAGGAAAPQRSLPLAGGIVATLPAHVFGRVEAADRRVVEAPWGSGPGEVGLEDIGPNVTPIGGSSFDVSDDGDVYVLDEANRRMLHWEPGAAAANRVPLAITGTLADMSVSADGTIHVLENAHADERRTLLKTFAHTGDARGTVAVPDRASQVRIGPVGPVVLQSSSGEWTSATNDGLPLSLKAQNLSGRSARPLVGGREVVVLRTGNELRVAVVGPGPVRRTWRVTSPTPLAEVQLAEPIGHRLVVVTRTYTDQASEFLVLVLGSKGVEQRLALDAADWAETAPVSRFRLRGSSLYQLGSTPKGLFVDRFDLEVNR